MEKRPRLRWYNWLLFGLVGLSVALQVFVLKGPGRNELPYSELRQAIAAKNVVSVTLHSSRVDGVLKTAPTGWKNPRFVSVRPNDPGLLDALLAAGAVVTAVEDSGFWPSALNWGLPLLFGLVLLLPMLRRASPLTFGKSRARVSIEASTGVTFEDVAGVDEAKEELQEVVDFLKTPAKFQRLGGRLPKGILLVGPPGTGKTLLARAVAGQANVPFFNISGSEFVELFVGVGAARVRDLFSQAKAAAPCIIFIDELDALGKVRGVSQLAHEEREQTLNQLLVELDGFDTRAGVVLMAATNRPETLDPALLRAGRFDRHVLVDRPDLKGRLAILKVHAKTVLLEDPADLERVASLTPGLAGADLANLVNEAALLAVRRSHRAVLREDLDEAVERVVAGLARHNRVLTRAERERVALHECGHALVSLALEVGPVQKVSIIPRGISALGYTLKGQAEDRRVLSRPELLGKVAVLLAGRAAESLELGSVSTGAEDDIAKATQLVSAMVRLYGMSEALGPIRLEAEREQGALFPRAHDYGDAIASEIDRELRWLLEQQERRAVAILTQRRVALKAAAQALLEHETLTGEQLSAVVESARAKAAA